MADLSTIDLASLLEREAAVRFGKVVGKKDPVRKGGPCPFCGQGEDRFAVFVVDVPHHYLCGIHGTGCGAYGDAITFLREYLGLDYHEACDYLAIDPGRKYDGPRTKQALHSEASLAPTDTWQKQAARFCLMAKEALWISQWTDALDWLTRVRRLSPDMIDRYGLGFNPKEHRGDPSEWGISLPEGETIWIPRGFVIPYQVGKAIWKVVIRRTDKDLTRAAACYKQTGRKGKPPKYVELAGSQQCLYGGNEIRPGEPLVLVEGPFDKIAFTQAIGPRVACVATGSTGSSRSAYWVEQVRLARPVLVAFDVDDNGAGDKSAASWKDLVPGARRLTPWAHDINDMLVQGMDLQAWLDAALDQATLQEPEDEPLVCAHCGVNAFDAPDFSYGEDGTPLCEEHWQERLRHPERRETHSGPDLLKDVASRIMQVCPSLLASEPMRHLPHEYLARRKAELDEAERPTKLPVEKASRLGTPCWLIPGTWEWNEQVRRHGATEMHERRAVWFAQHPHGPQPLPRLITAPLVAGSPEVQAHFLELGAVQGYPRLLLCASYAISAGEDAWRTYAVTHDDADQADGHRDTEDRD